MFKILFMVAPLFLNPPEGREMTDRMVPDGFIGNYWGPVATREREEGKMPPVRITPHMARWDQWGRQVLQDGDIVFRLGDARVLHGYFPMSRFYANCSNSKFSHTGIVAWRRDRPWSTTQRAAESPDSLSASGSWTTWATSASSGFARKIATRSPRSLPIAARFSRNSLRSITSSALTIQALLRGDDREGISLRRVATVGAGPNRRHGAAPEFPLCMMGLGIASRYVLEQPLTAETKVYFPGNERHGIWSSPHLVVVVPPTYKPGYPLMPDEGLPLVADSMR